MSNQRLQLTWYNKDKALIPIESGKYGYYRRTSQISERRL